MVMALHSVVCLTRELMFQQFRLCADNSYIQSCYSVILKQLDFYNSGIIFLTLNYDSNVETMETVTDLIFSGSKITAAMKLKDVFSLEKSCDKPRQCIKKQRHHFADKCLYSQSYGFSSSNVWM